jgi:hypothetical protein
MTEKTDKPTVMHHFMVQVSCSRLGDQSQQNSLDNLLQWSALMSPEAGLKLVAKLKAVLQETLAGGLSPLSESGEIAFEALGKDKQLALIPGTVCPIPAKET